MAVALRTTAQASSVAAPRLWTGRIVSGLAVLFLAFDGIIKVLQISAATEGTAQVGYSADVVLPLGVLQLACLAIYLLPRTAPLGAILLTGYLGGAIATHVRVESPAFSLIFPVFLGAFLWVGLYLRDARVRGLVS